MNEIQQEAFRRAKLVAELDFGYAIQGLLAGHETAMQKMRDALTQKDMALALSEKGARIDKDGIMAKRIIEGLQGKSLCQTERNFVERNSKDNV